jgi:hypothetical protein
LVIYDKPARQYATLTDGLNENEINIDKHLEEELDLKQHGKGLSSARTLYRRELRVK